MRTAGEPLALAPLVRETLRSVDPGMPMADARTLEEVGPLSVAPPRFRFVLIVVFAALSMLLAVVCLNGSR